MRGYVAALFCHQPPAVGFAHLDALLLDTVDSFTRAIQVDGLILVHIGSEAARADEEDNELVHRRLLGGAIARGSLIRVHPVVNEWLQRDVWLQ